MQVTKKKGVVDHDPEGAEAEACRHEDDRIRAGHSRRNRENGRGAMATKSAGTWSVRESRNNTGAATVHRADISTGVAEGAAAVPVTARHATYEVSNEGIPVSVDGSLGTLGVLVEKL